MKSPMQMRTSQDAGRNGQTAAKPQPISAAWDVRIVVSGLPMQSCAVLLSGAAGHIVVDTGFPQHESLLLEGLHRAGVEAAQVTGVINTHYHIDHIGGNALFPNAWLYGSRVDFEWAVRIYESVCSGETRREVFRTFYPEIRDEEFDRMDQARLLQLIKWMWDPAMVGDLQRYRWLEDEPLGLPGIEVLPTPGHTPKHISLIVNGSDDRYLVVGDARAFQDESALGYDMPPYCHADYQQSRRLISQFEGILIPGHDDPFSQSPDEDSYEEETASALARPPRPEAED